MSKKPAPVPYEPPDCADYLHGPMPTYEETGDNHIFNFRGKKVNMNKLKPFPDYYDGAAEPGTDVGYEDME